MAPKVGIAYGDDRQENIKKALKLIEDDIKEKIVKKRRVLIKPNLGFLETRLANTEGEAVEAVLEFLREFYDKKIIIVEGTTIGETPQGFSDYNYTELEDKYKVELVDLNEDDFKEFKIYDGRLKPIISIGLAETVLKSDFIISVCPMKTHDSVIVTLGIKNVAVGSIEKTTRHQVHQGAKAVNLNLAKIAKKLWPSLVVLDGFEAMEGDGPVLGDPVDFRTALAGTDALATDTIGAVLMGFDPSQIGYLVYCGKENLGCNDPLKIAVLGGNYRKLIRRFKPHYSYQQQLDWQI